jgi:hypothetical protein
MVHIHRNTELHQLPCRTSTYRVCVRSRKERSHSETKIYNKGSEKACAVTDVTGLLILSYLQPVWYKLIRPHQSPAISPPPPHIPRKSPVYRYKTISSDTDRSARQRCECYPLLTVKTPTRCNSVSKLLLFLIFKWSSTCFGWHTVHHQEPKTAQAAAGFAYVEGCQTCSCWTMSNNCTSDNLPRMQNQRLLVQF